MGSWYLRHFVKVGSGEFAGVVDSPLVDFGDETFHAVPIVRRDWDGGFEFSRVCFDGGAASGFACGAHNALVRPEPILVSVRYVSDDHEMSSTDGQAGI